MTFRNNGETRFLVYSQGSREKFDENGEFAGHETETIDGPEIQTIEEILKAWFPKDPETLHQMAPAFYWLTEQLGNAEDGQTIEIESGGSGGFDHWHNVFVKMNPVDESSHFVIGKETEDDFYQPCKVCEGATAPGYGKYVNRIVADDGFICAECLPDDECF